MIQEQLDFSPATARKAASGRPVSRRSLSLDERFEAWLADNGHVYTAVRRAALAAVRAGTTRLSIAKIIEELRADRSVATTGDSWKLNNSFRAPLARRLMDAEPEFEGHFEIRVRKSVRK